MKLRTFALLLAALLLAACGTSEPTAQPTSATGGAAATPTTAAPAATTETGGQLPTVMVDPGQPTSGAPLVVYTQEGGMKGSTSVMTIEPSGEAHLAVEGLNRGPVEARWIVAPEQLLELKGVLEDPAVAQLKGSYLPSNTCCDRIQHTITIGDQTIVTLDAAEHPEVVSQLIDVLWLIQDEGMQSAQPSEK